MFAKRANLPRTANTSRKELHTDARFDMERNITQDCNIGKKGDLMADGGQQLHHEGLIC
jgi:hypothetical protein